MTESDCPLDVQAINNPADILSLVEALIVDCKALKQSSERPGYRETDYIVLLANSRERERERGRGRRRGGGGGGRRERGGVSPL